MPQSADLKRRLDETMDVERPELMLAVPSAGGSFLRGRLLNGRSPPISQPRLQLNLAPAVSERDRHG